jgi:hypothetical protein
MGWSCIHLGKAPNPLIYYHGTSNRDTQLFGANFSYSWGPVAWLTCAEIFSPGHRSQAVSIIISCNYMMNVSLFSYACYSSLYSDKCLS